MFISYKLLCSLCPKLKLITIQQFCDACLSVGIEVERIIRHPANEKLKLVKILDVKQHPKADKLKLVKINYNQEELQIVCGANNLIINHYAIYAPLGTKLHNGLEMNKKIIREIESCGMLCSYAEITNINPELLHQSDIEGIVLISPKNLSTKNIQKLLNLDDVIIDVTLPSNRNDLNALICLCQEISAPLKIDFKNDFTIENDYYQTKFIQKLNIESKISQNIGYIQIQDLPQYETTWAEKEILCSCGYKVHNNWLDFFNLTTIINGNPISVYDADKLGLIKQLNVRRILKELTINDSNKTYTVPKNTIAIFNGEELINIPGILPIEKYCYTNQSTNIIIEVGNFNHLYIRNSAEIMKMTNHNIQLFSKPISSWITINTFNSLYNFFLNISSKIAVNISYFPNDYKYLKLDVENFNRFIGINFAPKAIYDILLSLNFLIAENGDVIVHPARLDIENTYDLYEEILKIVNINKLPIQNISMNVIDINRDRRINRHNDIRRYWINNGSFETKTYNLTSLEEAKLFNFNLIENFVEINNPISKNRQFVRVSLINDLLNVLKYNQSYKRQNYNVFEIQQLFDKDKKVYQNLGIVFYGDILNNNLTDVFVANNLQNVESLVYNMFQTFNMDVTFNRITDLTIDQIYNDQLIGVFYQEKLIGYISMIKNNTLKKYDLTEKAICVFLNIEYLLDYQTLPTYHSISSFPLVTRDINFQISPLEMKGFNYLLLKMKTIPYVQSAIIKDIFLKDNQWIITVCLQISSNSKTLTLEEIDAIVNEAKKLKY